jgi:hypothetical protein
VAPRFFGKAVHSSRWKALCLGDLAPSPTLVYSQRSAPTKLEGLAMCNGSRAFWEGSRLSHLLSVSQPRLVWLLCGLTLRLRSATHSSIK